MARSFVALLALASVCAAYPDKLEDSPLLKAVANPRTPNQVLDAIAEEAVAKIEAAGWNPTKRIQNGNSEIPIDVNGSGDTPETLTITDGTISNLATLRRSKSASFNAAKTQLTGTLVAENVCADVTYNAVFPAVGVAPAQNVNGEAAECEDKVFADLVVNIDPNTLKPQSIRSFAARSGHDSLNASNLDNNAMKDVHAAGIRKALKQLIVSTMNKNVKVKVNQAIQTIKNA